MATTKKQPAKKPTTKKPQSAKAKAKPAPAAPAKKLSQIQAALEVLKTATEPMTCKQMVEAMAERKLWASPGGKTSEATLYASLLRELAMKGDAARFVKASPGRFAVKWAFAAVRQGKTVGAVVRELQARKLLTVYGNPFDYGSTLGLLVNPTYAGTLRAGVDSRAKFCALATDGLIVVENAHEPIVPPEQFEEVQRILANRKRQHDRVPGRHTLAGMVTCGHCVRRMSGVHRKDYNHGEGGRFYHCNPSPLKLGYDPTCPHPAFRADRLEAFVLEAIRTHLIDAGAEERIRAAIVRSRSKQATQTSQDERRLAEVRRKIARGTENLALADREDFAGISKLLEEWRAEETRLVEQIERRKDELKPLPEALRVIARFAEYRDQLQMADRVALVNALRVTVASITVRVPATRTGGIDHNEYAGELRFHPGFGIAGPVAIPDEMIGYRKIWREIATLAKAARGPIRLADVMRHIGSEDPSLASYHVRRAIKTGLLKEARPHRRLGRDLTDKHLPPHLQLKPRRLCSGGSDGGEHQETRAGGPARRPRLRVRG